MHRKTCSGAAGRLMSAISLCPPSLLSGIRPVGIVARLAPITAAGTYHKIP